jgi:TPR repeat protein
MRTYLKMLALTIILATVTLPASAQTSTPANVDPALLAKASAGDAHSQVEVADLYVRAGNVADQDPNRRIAAEMSASDYTIAADWYRKAAEQGFVPGQLHLAALYRDGKGVVRDMVQAAEWYRKAAEQGDADAQATLGLLYSIGQGVPHNNVEACFWLDLAAAVKGPNQEKYAASRQSIVARITVDQLEEVQERVAKWLAAHPRPDKTE